MFTLRGLKGMCAVGPSGAVHHAGPHERSIGRAARTRSARGSTARAAVAAAVAAVVSASAAAIAIRTSASVAVSISVLSRSLPARLPRGLLRIVCLCEKSVGALRMDEASAP
jgi:hypothetical protein